MESNGMNHIFGYTNIIIIDVINGYLLFQFGDVCGVANI
jgi:hypothetical protein